jgi:hypothetical protein
VETAIRTKPNECKAPLENGILQKNAGFLRLGTCRSRKGGQYTEKPSRGFPYQ